MSNISSVFPIKMFC